MLKARLRRYGELQKAALQLFWLPLGEKAKTLLVHIFLPVVCTIVVCAIVFIISESSPPATKFDKLAGVTSLGPYTVTEPGLNAICYDDNNSPSFPTCLAVINSTSTPETNEQYGYVVNMLTQDLIQNDQAQIRQFASYQEFDDKVGQWYGYDESELPDGDLPENFGYIINFSTTDEGLFTYSLTVSDSDLIRYLSSSSYHSTLALTEVRENRASGLIRLNAYLFDVMSVSTLASVSPSQPPLGTEQVSLVSSGVTAAPVSMSPSIDVFGYSMVLVVPLLVAATLWCSNLSIEASISRLLAQTGMHALPMLIASLTCILTATLLLWGATLICWGAFKGTFDVLYEKLTFGYGVFLVVGFILSSLIQGALIFASIPRRVPAVVLVICVPLLGQGLLMLMQLQESYWPFYVIVALIPSSLCANITTTLSRFKSLALSATTAETSLIRVTNDWRIGLSDIFSSNYPNAYTTAELIQQLAIQQRIQINSLRNLSIVAICSTFLQLVLIYVVLAIRPAEINGPWRLSRLFLRIPQCKVLSARNSERKSVVKNEEIKQNQDDVNVDKSDNTQIEVRPVVSPTSRALNTPQDAPSPQFNKQMPILTANDVEKHYPLKKREAKRLLSIGDNRVIKKKMGYAFLADKNISLELHSGITTGIVGENGAGKTTLLKMIMGTEGADKGSIELLGTRLGKASGTGPLDVLPLVGYVPQHDIIGKFTCFLHCFIMATCRGLNTNDARLSSLESLELVGLGPKANCNANTLSGGQKRRLMIAMALSGSPPLLILDEPEAGLSVDAKEELDEAIKRVKKSDVSIVLTEHDMEQIEELCDEVIILKDGSIVAKGTPLELRNTHAGYTLRVTFENQDLEKYKELLDVLSSYVPTTMTHVDGRNVNYALPADANVCIEDIAKSVEVTDGVLTYGIRCATLGDAVRDIMGDEQQTTDPPVNVEHHAVSYNSVIKVLVQKCFWSLIRNKVTMKCLADIVVVFVMIGTFSIFMPDLVSFLERAGTPIRLRNDATAMIAGIPIRWTGDDGGVMERWPESMYVENTSLNTALQDSSSPLVVFHDPTNITVYSTLVSSTPTLMQHSILLTIQALRLGYDRIPYINGGELTSLTGDYVYSTLPLVAWVMPLFAMLCSLSVGSLSIVISYLIVTERCTGFDSLMKLASKKRGSNTIAWFLSAVLPYAIINFIILFVVGILCLVRIRGTNTNLDTNDYIVYAAGTALVGMVSEVSWAMFGIWVCYRFKSQTTVLHIAPHFMWLMVIPFLIMASIMCFCTRDLTPHGTDLLWCILVWVFGCFPFSAAEVCLTTLLLHGLVPQIFELHIGMVFTLFGINIAIAILLFFVVFMRDELDQGYLKRMPLFLQKVLALGSRKKFKAKQPNNKERAKRGYSDGPPADDLCMHPCEDETVKEERDFVRNLPEQTVESNNGIAVMFRKCRREFCIKLPDGTKGVIAAVRCVDFAVRKGECLGLVGENGAGKSTALSMAIGELKPSFGEASLLVDRVGYVPQTNAHCAALTVKQHVKLFASLGGVDLDVALNIATFVGLNKHLAKRPSQLSGGYKRRLSLAIALITSTEMLIADEVAAGVDENARHGILSLIDSLKEAGCSVLMTSHDMDAVDRNASRVAVLVKGRLRTITVPEELKQRYGGGLIINMGLSDLDIEKAKLWLSETFSCEVNEIETLSSKGKEVKVMMPNRISTVRALSGLSPVKRPSWMLRVEVQPASLQSAFMKLQEESQELCLSNVVPELEK